MSKTNNYRPDRLRNSKRRQELRSTRIRSRQLIKEGRYEELDEINTNDGTEEVCNFDESE